MITSINDLCKALSKEAEITQAEAKRILDALSNVVINEAKSADETKIILPKIGTFKVNVRQAYTARNPKNGDPIDVPASKKMTFKTFPNFVDMINK